MYIIGLHRDIQCNLTLCGVKLCCVYVFRDAENLKVQRLHMESYCKQRVCVCVLCVCE